MAPRDDTRDRDDDRDAADAAAGGNSGSRNLRGPDAIRGPEDFRGLDPTREADESRVPVGADADDSSAGDQQRRDAQHRRDAEADPSAETVEARDTLARSPVPPETRSAWHPLARIFFYGGSLLLLTNLIAVLGIAVLGAISGDEESWRQQLSGDPSAVTLLGFYVAFAPAALLWTMLYRRRFDRRNMVSLGFARARVWTGLSFGLIIGALATGLVLAAGNLAGVYDIAWQSPSQWQGKPVALVLSACFVGFFLQGATEELILRGYVQRNLVEWKGANPSIGWVVLLPSLSFSFLHAANPGFNPVAAVNTFLIGVLFGATVLGSGHLWSAIGLHVGWNFGLGCLVSLPVSGLQMPGLLQVTDRETTDFVKLFFGGEYGPEGGLAVTLLVLLGLSWALPRALDQWRVDHWGWVVRAGE